MPDEHITQENLFLDTGDVFRLGPYLAVNMGPGISMAYPDQAYKVDYMILTGEKRGLHQNPLKDFVRNQRSVVKISNPEQDISCSPYIEKIRSIQSALTRIFRKPQWVPLH